MSRRAFSRWLGLILILGLGAMAAPAVRAADAPTFTVTVPSAFLRSAPNAQAPATYSVFQGEVYPIIGRTGDNTWLQLAYPRATKGTWVLATLGKLTGDIGTITITAGVGAVEPTATVTSTPDTSIGSEPTPTAVSGPSEICVLLYDDANGNGKLDSNDKALTGGQLTLLDTSTGAVMATYVTTAGETNGHCFTDLPAGTYTVAAAAPPGYNATSEGSVVQQINAGQHYEITFGAQPGAAALSSGGQSYYLVGLAVASLLLVAGLTAFFIIRRR